MIAAMGQYSGGIWCGSVVLVVLCCLSCCLDALQHTADDVVLSWVQLLSLAQSLTG